MGLPLESSTWHERATSGQGDFEVTGKAVQLDAFFTFLTASTKPTAELHSFCQLVFDVVAGTDAYDVRERLMEYSEIRGNEEPSDAVSAILLAASRELEPSLRKEGSDPLRSARRVLSVVELMRQGLTAVERFAVLPLKREGQQSVCQQIADFLEDGRKAEAERLEAALRC